MTKHTTTISSKRCPDCGETKPASEYNKNSSRGDGLQGVCRACQVIRRTRERSEKGEHVRARARAWTAANRPLARSYANRYTRSHRKQMQSYTKQYRKDYREKYLAHVAVREAIERQVLPAANTQFCFVCGTSVEQEARMEYHHVDYSKPLEVIPVCAACHRSWHHAILE